MILWQEGVFLGSALSSLSPPLHFPGEQHGRDPSRLHNFCWSCGQEVAQPVQKPRDFEDGDLGATQDAPLVDQSRVAQVLEELSSGADDVEFEVSARQKAKDHKHKKDATAAMAQEVGDDSFRYESEPVSYSDAFLS